MKYFLLVCLIFFINNSEAQLLSKPSQNFTRADSLRGALRPERTCFDVHYYNLSLDIDIENKYISGFNEIYYTVEEDFKVLQIDLFDNMQIDSIVFEETNLDFKREFNAVFLHFKETQKKGTQKYFIVYYHGTPIEAKNPPWDGGFTWQKDKEDNDWIGVSCEGIGASLWWPNKDHLSDEPDSMRITCTVPENLIFVGNGTLENQLHDKDKKRKSYTWKVSYPINNYNVTLNIADYTNFQDEYTALDGEKLLLDYWVLPANLEKAKTHFGQVKPMLGCFEEYFGKFPFWKDGYKLVETPYLGMEHQTAIAYGNNYRTGYNGYDYSRIGLDFDYIIIHETGHEYWGNLISAKDIADMWIHESFCTYSEAVYVECLHGYDTAQLYINAKKPSVRNRNPIAGVYDVNQEGDGDMYNKGMLMLNTLRHIINDDELWWNMLKDMTTNEFAYKTITANDIMFYFNRKTKMDLAPFFFQYLYYPSLPTLYYAIDRDKRNYTLSYQWQTDVPNFEMPIVVYAGKEKVRLKGTNNLQSIEFKLKKKDKISFDEDAFYFNKRKYNFNRNN